MTSSISACIITRNEDSCLARCLTSIKKLVREIILVDTGSTDSTVQIARQFDAKVYSITWPDNFALARNESLRQATADWILVIDADEYIDEQGVLEIKNAVEGNSDAYFLAQKNYTNAQDIAGCIPLPHNEYFGFYMTMICRLFKNKKGYHFEGEVHEQIEPSILKNNGTISTCNAIIHHPTETNPAKIKQKKEYYLKLAKVKAKNHPAADSYFELGVLYKENNMANDAENSLKTAITYNPRHRMALYELGTLKQKAGDFQGGLSFLKKSLEIKDDAETLFGLGVCTFKMGDISQAESYFSKSLVKNPNKYATYNNLGMLYEKKGEFEKSIAMLSAGIKLYPANTVGYYNLAIVCDKTGNFGNALNNYTKAAQLGHPKSEQIKKRIEQLKQIIESEPSYSFKLGSNDNFAS